MPTPKFNQSLALGATLLGCLGLAGAACAADGKHPVAVANACATNPAVVWEGLPSIRTGVKIHAHTSKSALNCTIMDWTNYTLQDADGYEQACVKGSSGMLVHAWFAWAGQADGNLKLYLKDSLTPAHNLPITEYFKAGKPQYQLWYNQNGSIWWAFPCLPFEGAFKACLTKRPDWYQYTLHLYREKHFAETPTRENVDALQARLQAPVGTFPGTDPGNRVASTTLENAARGKVVFDVTKPGVIRSIRITPSTADSAVLDKLTIRVTTDGAVTAELPVTMFFGGYRAADMRNAKGLPAGYDGKKLYCYFPMPFWRSMKVELVNEQAGPVSATCEIGWSDSNTYPQASTGVFKVQFNDNVAVKAGAADFANLAVDGAGVLVGCVSKLTGDIEGNFSIFTDGSNTPVVETTGGEDYFNHSYGIHPGICNPFSGGLAEGTGYRFHILDYVPFLNSIKLTQDHAHAFTHDRDGTFLSAVYYYHTPRSFLNLTDSLDVGKPEAEAAHHYQAHGTPGKRRLQTDTSGYEGNCNELITDDGRWTDKGSSFSVKITPDNDGVRLRKRLNEMTYHQEVDVYVDGTLAGIWFEQGANHVLNYDHAAYKELVKNTFAKNNQEVPSWQDGTMPTKFRDTEFEIPAALTKGKAILNLKMVTRNALAVKPADDKLTNEYYYWVYCYANISTSPDFYKTSRSSHAMPMQSPDKKQPTHPPITIP